MMAEERFTGLETAKAILVLEFINAEQFPGQIRSSVPFLKGYANWLGTPCRWIRYGLASAHFYQHGKDAVTLTTDELARLEDQVAALAPQTVDLVVTTHALGSEVQETLARLVPQARTVLLDELEWTRQWPKGPLPMEMDRPGFRPDYLWEAGNSPALRKDRNNIYILGSVGCGYRKSVRSNPYYEPLEIPESLMGGCAFCGARVIPGQMLDVLNEGGEHCAPDIRAWRELVAGRLRIPIEFVRLQIETIAQTLPPERRPNALLFGDIERPEILEKAVEVMRSFECLKGVKLLAGLRVDRLLQLEEWLWRVFGKNPNNRGTDTGTEDGLGTEDSSSLSLQLFSCGLENFSAPELDRMNKGTTPWMNLRAVNLIKELEIASQGRFYYSGYMGLSVLLFTPWTTLDQLHLNASLLLHLQLENEVGNLFMSRLRLHPDLAITLLAKHDGVVVDKEDDPALVLNRRKLFEEELPWKHLDPRMEPVSKVAVRLEPDQRLQDDSLYRQIHSLLLPKSKMESIPGSRGAQRRMLVSTLLAVVETAALSDGPLQADELVRRTADRLNRPQTTNGNDRWGGKTSRTRWATLASPEAGRTWQAQARFLAGTEAAVGAAVGTEAAAGTGAAVGTEAVALLFDLTDDSGEVVRIQVQSADEDGLYYRVPEPCGTTSHASSAWILESLAKGNRLRLCPGQIQVLSDQQLVGLWTASVGLWYPQRSWHAAEWRELALAALRNSDPRAAEAQAWVERHARMWIADPVILGGDPHA